MIFRETGPSHLPSIILLHGAGLSDWSWEKVVFRLSTKYHIITPIIDGHGEDAGCEFISIANCAHILIDYIDSIHKGKVLAIGGLSLGAQIALEVLSIRSDIAQYAIIESALVYPLQGTSVLVPMYRLFYGLIKRRCLAKIQAAALYIPDELFESYYNDSLKITKPSLINIALSNGSYTLKGSISNTTARVLIIVGSKEIKIMQQSAALLHSQIKNSQLFIAEGMKHGQFSLRHSEQYIEQLRELLRH